MLEPDKQLQSQEEGRFSEYTELDVIPFSQIELAEDFLSEGTASLQGQNHSQKGFRKRNSMVLIKRRSPRLSSTHFRATSLASGGRSTSAACSGLNSCVSRQGLEKISFYVSSKRKRTKTALLLSSLFQFFIDEAKRNQSFREFELPRDLVEQVLNHEHSEKDISKEMQKNYPKYVGEFNQCVDMISETELDSVIQSEVYAEVFGNTNVLLGNSEIEDAEQSESQTESLKLKSDQERNFCTENDAHSLSNPHYDNASPVISKLFKVKNISDIHSKKSVPGQDKVTSANQIKSSSRKQLFHEVSSQNFLKTSPCLFGTQSNSGDSMKDSPQPMVVPDISKAKGPQAASTEAQLLFTPRTMHTDENYSRLDGSSWITFAGCAESGCKKRIVALLRGIMENAEGEKSPYLLSVQPTSLTLWSYHDDVTWTAELHWYLPPEHEALNACNVSDAGQRLVAAAWGSSFHSSRLFLTVFIFHWNTHQTLRFNLRLPLTVCPLRLFCHGLPKVDQSTLVVFSIDKTYSRGRKYVLNTDSSNIDTQSEMEVIGCQLLDVQLVQGLSEAVAGLSSDNKILLWNHVTGVLIISLNLESPLPMFSRMFTCFSHQGFLLLHMQAIDAYELCLVGINPMKSTGKVLQVFHHSDHQERLSSLTVHENLVLAATGCGKIYVWDAVSATHLAAITNSHGCITCINIIPIKNNLCLASGHSAGCIHLYHLA
ncbi:uncharacterized protein LOC112561397 [Pomacea canaliculata]|uniref:uncharacterized protein LOC112561397 n=1 Tax=Pomacea canaliculata TaxID=400727 RepID=UPI000D73E6E5|nr:uncharacterized protein LOC112561397 [Pomacea canaliculata]XP_025089784.1 uncharacterized protein LOC112561397 [Pomacea canaliculata]